METRRLTNESWRSGALLILLGLIFLGATSGVAGLSWGNIWPAFLIAFGVLDIARAFTEGKSNVAIARSVASGSFLLLLGGYFFTITLGAFAWSDQREQWPLYLIFLGVSSLAGFAASRLQSSRYFVTGLSLSLLGGGFLAATLSGLLYAFEWEWTKNMWTWVGTDWAATWWPVFPIAIGMALLLASAIVDRSSVRGAFALAGTIPLLIGVFHLATTLGYLSWEDQGRLWPLYPLIVGTANLVAYVASDARYASYLWSGLTFGVIGATFLSISLMGEGMMGQLWPILLIVAGLLLFLTPWTHTRGPGHKTLGSR